MDTEIFRRIGTGVLGAIFSLTALLAAEPVGLWACYLLTTVLALGTLAEFAAMGLRQRTKQWLMLAMGSLAWVVLMWNPRCFFEVFEVLFVGLFIFYLFPFDRKFEGSKVTRQSLGRKEQSFTLHGVDLTWTFFGLFYILLGCTSLLKIRLELGVHCFLFFLLLHWTQDSMAYFVGRFLGRCPLPMPMSAKKTWEGAFAGLFFGALVGVAFYAHQWITGLKVGNLGIEAALPTFWSPSLWSIIGISLITSILGQAGDLCESLLKRAQSVKDSGTLLPGHGGLLDRFDSVLASAPIFYELMKLWWD